MRLLVVLSLLLLAGVTLVEGRGVVPTPVLPPSTLSLWYPPPSSNDCVFDQGSMYTFTPGSCDSTLLTTTYGKLWFTNDNVTTVLLFVSADSTSLHAYGFENETACENFGEYGFFVDAFAYPTNLVQGGQPCASTPGVVVQPPSQQGPAAPTWPPVGYYSADRVGFGCNASIGMFSTLTPLESCVETLGKRFLRNYCTLDPVSGNWNLTTVFYPLPGCNTMPMSLQIQQQGVCYGDVAFRCPEQGVSSQPPTIGGPLVITTDYGIETMSCASPNTPVLTIVQPRDKCILPSYGNTWIAHECDSQKQQLTIWFFDEHGCGSGPPTSNSTYPIGTCVAQGGDTGCQ